MSDAGETLRLVFAGWVDALRRNGSPGPAAEMRVTDPDGYVLMLAASR